MLFLNSIRARLIIGISGLSALIMITMGYAFFDSAIGARDEIMNSLEQGASKMEASLLQDFSALEVSQEQAAAQSLEQKARSVANFVARLSPESLLTFELDKINEFCQIAHGDSDIAICYVVDTEGEPVTTDINQNHPLIAKQLVEGSNDIKSLARRLEADPDLAKIAVDVSLSGERVGGVVVFADRAMEYQAAEKIQVASKATIDSASAGLENLQGGVVESSERAREQMNALLVPLNIGILVGAVILSILFARSISRPMRILQKISARVAEGDLTVEIPKSRLKEAEQLGEGFRSLITALREIVGSVLDSTKDLNTSSGVLSELADQLHSGADGTKSRSSTVAAAVEEMAMSMNSMVDNARSMSESVDGISTSIDEVMQASQQLAERSELASEEAVRATELAHASNTQIKELDLAASEIGSIVTLIQDVAEKTNLLALNAAIEAARAGEEGRGFAVVADEVKKLAQQTASASGEIRDRILKIQSSTNESVTTLADIGQVIESANAFSTEVASSVAQQSTLTKAVSSHAGTANENTGSVQTSIEESNSATGDIARSIAEVDTMAGQTLEAAVSTREHSEELGNIAGRLDKIVSWFKVA
jgi:methyl-accepting chemotaxis protein